MFSLFLYILILFMHHFTKLIKHLFENCVELFARSFICIPSFLQCQFLQLYFVPLMRPYFSLFSCPFSFVLVSAHIKKYTYFLVFVYWLWQRRPSPVIPARHEEGLWIYILWTCVCRFFYQRDLLVSLFFNLVISCSLGYLSAILLVL